VADTIGASIMMAVAVVTFIWGIVSVIRHGRPRP
jgi:hypothetical protein